MPEHPLVHLLTELSNHFPYTGVGLRAGDSRKQAAKGEEGSCAASSAVCEHAAAEQRASLVGDRESLLVTSDSQSTLRLCPLT